MENYCRALGTEEEPIAVVQSLYAKGGDGRSVYGSDGDFINLLLIALGHVMKDNFIIARTRQKKNAREFLIPELTGETKVEFDGGARCDILSRHSGVSP